MLHISNNKTNNKYFVRLSSEYMIAINESFVYTLHFLS